MGDSIIGFVGANGLKKVWGYEPQAGGVVVSPQWAAAWSYAVVALKISSVTATSGAVVTLGSGIYGMNSFAATGGDGETQWKRYRPFFLTDPIVDDEPFESEKEALLFDEIAKARRSEAWASGEWLWSSGSGDNATSGAHFGAFDEPSGTLAGGTNLDWDLDNSSLAQTMSGSGRLELLFNFNLEQDFYRSHENPEQIRFRPDSCLRVQAWGEASRWNDDGGYTYRANAMSSLRPSGSSVGALTFKINGFPDVVVPVYASIAVSGHWFEGGEGSPDEDGNPTFLPVPGPIAGTGFVTLDAVIEAKEFFPYAKRDGSPLYNTTTGVPI